MSWARIMAPLSGGEQDAAVLTAARLLAEPFDAELSATFVYADVGDVMPWIAEGDIGGIQASALEALKEAASIGERRARASLDKAGYANSRFVNLQSPIWAELSAESRLSDVVVFGDEPGRGRGALAEAFQQILADEQRPVLVARKGLKADGCILVAWDGGKEASRAVRLAMPLLEKAQRVVIASAPKATSRRVDPARLQAYCAQRGVKAELEILDIDGDVGQELIAASGRIGADLLVAGAFGHPRVQEYIFGGTTKTLLNADGPSLFLSH